VWFSAIHLYAGAREYTADEVAESYADFAVKIVS
jgi:hypothetical protein